MHTVIKHTSFSLRRGHSIITIICCCCLMLCPALAIAQNIPVSREYRLLYDFLDELAGEGAIHLNSAIQPYLRNDVANKLLEAQAADSLLNKRQRADLRFYLNEFALECDTVPDNWVEWTNRQTFNLSLAQPAFHYLTPKKNFKMSIRPILGMDLYASKKGAVIKRWWGAEISMDIMRHVSLWGSLRDVSWNGKALLSDKYYDNSYGIGGKIEGAKLTKPQYLNNLPGAQYKEATYGGDFSDSRGGISLYSWWGSIGMQRETIAWGDAYHCSNILSGHNPAVPMLTINLKPVRWFEFNWFHAWLVSNVIDSTNYYTENYGEGLTKRHYRPANKFMAANMFTFSPIRQLSFSFGNSIVYAERNVQALYFIPIAFYKSLDHLATKGLGVENQNSQLFFTINTRNLKHVNFYASLFVDEFKFSRLKKSNPQHNPISYLAGVKLSNWPLQNFSVKAEFMRSYIACYTHSIDVLSYTSNSYGMGHYMGDNSQNIYTDITYKPIRGLSLSLSYTNDTKYNKYDYVRADISEIIAQKPFNERIYQNDTFGFNAIYEVFNNCYAVINLSYNNARGFAPASERTAGEDRGGTDKEGNPKVLEGEALQQYYLQQFAPVYWQGKNLTFMCGLSFNF
ncbi:MAG: hypothetical protein NC038_07975 [Paludibacter sp.]|nr:hypothetical protein [Bacteroides sp.]MCM1403718.1 hypothetical protein [Bacteroides sp.]MCM1443472.1 hypothetical protein [Muribaculum sp.]MCM1482556.1 hypothetical protein [Paludibacter sp.]MCM1576950.1 hypothetical protein [Bacteroides sp.]